MAAEVGETCTRFRCALQAFCNDRAAFASLRAVSTVLSGASAICWTLFAIRARPPRPSIPSQSRDLPPEAGTLKGLDLGHGVLHLHLAGCLQAQKLLEILLSGHFRCMILS